MLHTEYKCFSKTKCVFFQKVNDIVGKGRGVIATKVFMKGDFVVEYHGDHIDTKTARKRESEYAADPSIGCYMYYYQYNNKAYW